jgi:hypothetical protein
MFLCGCGASNIWCSEETRDIIIYFKNLEKKTKRVMEFHHVFGMCK